VREGALKVVCLPLEPLPLPSVPSLRPMSDAMGTTTPLGTPPRREKSSRAPSTSVAGPSTLDDPQHVVPSTFTTCLSIPVIGTRPLKGDNKNKNTSETVIVPAGPANPSRMSRGSTKQPSGIQSSAPAKPASSRTTGTTDATNGHEQQQQTASTHLKNAGTPEKEKDARRHPNLGIPPIHVAEKLDMNTVRTSVPRVFQPAKEKRPFEIDDVPSFYPTAEEFVDPMGYLRSIRPKAERYGICKITPPETWKMPFVTNTEVR
jgi:[histone H3]-trimethyl-L-lysine4 demethylase